MLDINNFKNINDIYGYDYGYEMLKMMAARLKQFISAPNIVVRLGDDEFLILLQALDSIEQQVREQVLHIVDQVRQILNQVFIFKGRNFQTSASIGGFIFRNAELNQSAALKYTTWRFMKPKQTGKIVFVFLIRVWKKNY